MAKGKVEVNVDCCKGCEYCITACKSQCLALSGKTELNRYSFLYVMVVNDKCTSCGLCAKMCPEQGIRVCRQ